MTKRHAETKVEFVCIGECQDDDPPTWMVEGRWDAEGHFEPALYEETDCPECGEQGEPTDSEVRVAGN